MGPRFSFVCEHIWSSTIDEVKQHKEIFLNGESDDTPCIEWVARLIFYALSFLASRSVLEFAMTLLLYLRRSETAKQLLQFLEIFNLRRKIVLSCRSAYI